ncbi:MAG: hypothetical protein C4617_04260 [Candidatus Liberibacter europaeus]|uniref:Peptidoglycan binding-like domain-containing protein n=1 Tax=Candidatus Liberibacter europaeus TaxID=744859 RepID=A0A2T4VXB5_9HYPH|nr:hypothetical protein [Candidatus Liberibacter europaeus]PTL86417.1 MAG: hypothetical protein C4617_04260 [Candidatus Liberibacter europaeus]
MFKKGYGINFPGIFLQILRIFSETIFRYPKFISITIGYSIVFILILYNALWCQNGKHPSPMFVTRDSKSDQIFLGYVRNMKDHIKGNDVTFKLERVEDVGDKVSFVGPVTIGEKSIPLQEIQKKLKELNLYHGYCDGFLNQITKEAISSFQRIIDVPVNGLPNNDLLQLLKNKSIKRKRYVFKQSSFGDSSVVLTPEYYAHDLIADIINNSKIRDF